MNNFEKSSELVLILRNKEHFLCTPTLISKSTLLKEMIGFSDNTEEPVPVPNFVSSRMLSEIMQLLDSTRSCLQEICQTKYPKLIQMWRISEFLDIQNLSRSIRIEMYKRLDQNSCFEIYSVVKFVPSLSWFTEDVVKCILTNINQFYKGMDINKFTEDEFVEQYKTFSLSEVYYMLCTKKVLSTISKILVFKNWWSWNQNKKLEEQVVVEILQNINEKASYIPRQEIKFMREIRDEILSKLHK